MLRSRNSDPIQTEVSVKIINSENGHALEFFVSDHREAGIMMKSVTKCR